MSSSPQIISAVLNVSMKKIFDLSCQLTLASSGKKNWIPALAGMTILLSTLISLPSYAVTSSLPTITVMADNSLSLVVTEIARNYSQTRQEAVNISFLPQQIQQEQISDGAAADVLITSKAAWIDELKMQGLVDIYSQTKLAGDRLVLIGPLDSEVVSQGAGRFPFVDIIKAGGGEPNFLIGNPETLMEGYYSREAMRNLGVADDLEEYTLYLKRLDQMLDMVVSNKAFAVCFYSSVSERKDMKVIDTIPEAAHKPIVYYAVVIAGDNMNQARNFLDYLKSSEVNKLFRQYGFVTD